MVNHEIEGVGDKISPLNMEFSLHIHRHTIRLTNPFLFQCNRPGSSYLFIFSVENSDDDGDGKAVVNWILFDSSSCTAKKTCIVCPE